MKILFWSDATAHTGFAQVTHNIGERLVRDFGHDVAVLGINSRGDFWDTPLRVYRANMLDQDDLYGISRIVEIVGREMPDAIIIVNDAPIVLSLLLDNKHDPERVLWRGLSTGDVIYRPPILTYLTADGTNTPSMADVLAERCTRIAMSHFGQQAMPEAEVVYHGVDTSVFRPTDRREAKIRLGYDPDDFLVVRSDKNSIRKDYASTYFALRPLMRKYPNIRAHFHCQMRTLDGYDLRALMWDDEDIRERVNFSAGLGGYTGWPEENLALLMAAADLHVSTSWGEGFGLNLLQSLACGTPVIATDCSAITEVVGPGGILIKPKGFIAAPMGQLQALPDVEGFTRAIEHFYQSAGLRRDLRAAAIAHAATMTWDYAAEAFDRIVTREIVRTKEPALTLVGT